MAELKIHRRVVDLDEVAGLDQQEYDDLVHYAKQWDEPANEVTWLSALEKARGTATEPDEEVEGWARLTVAELKEELESRDLPVSGNKDELVERLNEVGATPE